MFANSMASTQIKYLQGTNQHAYITFIDANLCIKVCKEAKNWGNTTYVTYLYFITIQGILFS